VPFVVLLFFTWGVAFLNDLFIAKLKGPFSPIRSCFQRSSLGIGRFGEWNSCLVGAPLHRDRRRGDRPGVFGATADRIGVAFIVPARCYVLIVSHS
jgi:hypothetical protein